MKLQWASGLLLGAAANYVDASHVPFATDSTGLRPYDSAVVDPEIKYQSPPPFSHILDRDNWKLDCSPPKNGHKDDCNKAIDGWSKTYWTRVSDSKDRPNSIIVDLGSSQNVTGLTMLPRMEKDTRGQISNHKVFLRADDSEEWGQPVAHGTWGWNKGMKLSVFDPTPARYVKLLAESEAIPAGAENKFTDLETSIVDLNVYAANFTIPVVPGKGVWGPTIDFPVVPVAAAQNQNGHIILWSAWADDQFFASPGGNTFTSTWDPVNQTILESVVAGTEHDMFCPGISMDIDGNIVVSGGADSGRTSIYDGNSWNPGPPMKIRRGYQASTTLANGGIFVIGGSWSGNSKTFKSGELYDPIAKTWTKLPGADVRKMLTKDKEGRWRADNHGWLFGWKENTVFQAGPSIAMNWYFTNGTGSVTPAGNRLDDNHSMSGNAVMYNAVDGKIITFGGQQHYDGSDGSSNAHLITLGEPNEKPLVQKAGNGSCAGMNYQRVFHTSVVLPDGSVFTAGGEEWGKPFLEDRGIQFTPEIYYPHNDSFVPMQSNNVIRVYHSVSMLQPDGTVLNGGGGLCGACTANHYDAQIFTPPYLLNADGSKATQPKITGVENSYNKVLVGETIRFTTDSDIEAASLIRLGSATHTVNTDQRRIPLVLESGAQKNTYETKVPGDPGIALPGYYMLFVLNSKGVPSVAEIIKVELALRSTITSTGEDNGSEEEDNDDDDEEEKEKEEGCDMDDDADIEGMISAMAASTRKFWKTWKSALVTQG